MLASGTADGDGQVAAVGKYKFRNPAIQKIAQVGDHVLYLRMLAQVFRDGLIQSGEISQTRFPERIGQAARIKYKVGIAGNAMLESK